MKSLRVFLCLLIAGALMTACEKNSVEELDTLTEEVNSSTANLTIEYTSLEALNKAFEENGIPTITLEELGITEEEYLAGQERINNKEIARSRAECSANLNTTFQNDADFNNNNQVTLQDVILAQRVILGLDPPSDASDDYGTLSWSWNGSNPFISTFDSILVQRWLLGVLC